MALELAIICAVAGTVLGLRYNVLILVPAVMCAMLFAVIVGIARADSFGSIALLTVALGAAVQLGYLAGVVLYAAVESICAGRGRGRNHELGLTWPQTWQTHSWQLTPSSAHRPRQPPP